MNPCIGAYFNHGHKFEPRYDVTPPANMELKPGGSDVASILALVGSLSKKTYVCDVCVRCGEVVKREPK